MSIDMATKDFSCLMPCFVDKEIYKLLVSHWSKRKIKRKYKNYPAIYIDWFELAEPVIHLPRVKNLALPYKVIKSVKP